MSMKDESGISALERQKLKRENCLSFLRLSKKSEKIVKSISAVRDRIAILSEIYPVIYRRSLEHIENPVDGHAGKDPFW